MGLQFQREVRISSTTLPDELITSARSLVGRSAVFIIGNYPSRLWVLDCDGDIPYSSYVRGVANSVQLPEKLLIPSFWVRRPPANVDGIFRIGGTSVDSILTLPWEELLHSNDRYPRFLLQVKVVKRHRPPVSDEGGLVEIEIATDNREVAEQVKMWLGGFVATKPGTTYAYTHELVYFFRPPIQSSTYFPEGVLARSLDIFEKLTLEPDLLNKHVLVCGQTGYGKTNTTKLLLEHVIKRNDLEGLLILDPHGQYRDWADKHKVLFISAGRHPEELSKLHINPFVPPRSQRLDSYLDVLSVVFSVSAFRGGGTNLPAYMRQLLRSYFQSIWSIKRADLKRILHSTGNELIERGFYRSDTSSNLLQDFCDYWHSKKGEILREITGGQVGSNLADLSGAITARLNELEMSFLAYFDYSPIARSIGNLLGQKVVISLQGASERDIDLIVSLLSTAFVETALLRDESDRFRNLLVVEEAHRVMSRDSSDSAEFQTARQRLSSTFQKAFRELRSRGVGLIAIDQSPHTLIDEAFANSSLKITHHIELPADQLLMNNLFQTNEINLASFEIGECLIKIEENPAYRTKMPRWNASNDYERLDS